MTRLLAGDRTCSLPGNDSEWTALLMLAAQHWLLPALWVALRDAGRVPVLPDEVLVDIDSHVGRERTSPPLVLQRAYIDNALRNGELLAMTEVLISALGSKGIRAIPLKGIDSLVRGLWLDAGARVMGDVDLLVEPNREREAFALLRSIGYRESEHSIGEYADHQLPMLEGETGMIVELHMEVLVRRWRAILPARTVWEGVASRGPAKWNLMNEEHAVTHLVAHAQLQDDTYSRRELPLRALHELAAWSTEPAGNVDWHLVRDCFARMGRQAVLDASLTGAAELYGAAVPTRRSFSGRSQLLLGRSGVRWPRFLRWYSYMLYLPRSFSHARMEAEFGRPKGRCWLARARTRYVVTRLVRLRVSRPRRSA